MGAMGGLGRDGMQDGMGWGLGWVHGEGGGRGRPRLVLGLWNHQPQSASVNPTSKAPVPVLSYPPGRRGWRGLCRDLEQTIQTFEFELVHNAHARAEPPTRQKRLARLMSGTTLPTVTNCWLQSRVLARGLPANLQAQRQVAAAAGSAGRGGGEGRHPVGRKQEEPGGAATSEGGGMHAVQPRPSFSLFLYEK